MDARFRLLGRQATGGVVVVSIDPKSLAALDVWPWPRGYHATVIEHLLAAGAERIGFDVDFSSRSVRDEDLELERALASSQGRVVLPVFGQWTPGPALGRALTFSEPLPAFRRHVTPATINVLPEHDGLTRRYGTGGLYDGRWVPTLAAALLETPVTRSERFYIDFGIAPDSVPVVSYVDVLTGQFDRRMFHGRAVIVGSTAVELGDQFSVPLFAVLPGPIVQALGYESLVQGRALDGAGLAAVLGLALALGMFLGPKIAGASWRAGLAMVVGASAGAFALSLAIQRSTPVMLDVSPTVVTLIAIQALALVRRIDQQGLRLILQALSIRRTETRMRHVVENSFDAIVTLHQDGRIETFNRAAQRMFGFGARDAVGRPLEDLVTGLPGESEKLSSAIRRGAHRTFEAIARRLDGSVFPVELALTEIAEENERRRVLFIRDITERKVNEAKLQHQANYDALTDLPNRYLLGRRVEACLAHAKESRIPVAFLILDLDRFKEINDSLGHHTGDLVLRQIADRLQRSVRPMDTIARLGGDEFALLLPDTDATTARQVARRVMGTLEEPLRISGLSLQVDTSIGIAMYPGHGTDATTLARRADVAMYVAKRARTGVGVYDPEQDFTSVHHLTLMADLRGAIETDSLCLHYQPKVSAIDGRPVGAEALIRWVHPQHGAVSPDEFVRLAEQGGLIRSLTQWVIRTATAECSRWHREGVELGVAVNVSARNLLEEDLPQAVADTLKSVELPPGFLTLEITESMIMEDPVRALEVVHELHLLGVGISIDDFGTGYSSLAYLKKLRAKELKIDRAFVMEMDRDPEDAVIVRSTIELAHNLGLRVVAEGVETEAVWKVLRALGCDYGQGYYFSRPVPAAQLLGLVEGHSAFSMSSCKYV